MVEANYFVKTERPDLSTKMSAVNNVDFEFMSTNYMLNKSPDYFIYLYNLSEVNMGDDTSFYVSRPPLIRSFRVKMKPKGAKYILATKLPQPLSVPKGNVDSNEVDIVPQDARRFAMDIINPDNWGIKQDAYIEKPTSIGNDLGKKGVFWSFNGPGATKDAYGNDRTFIMVDGVKTTVAEEPTEAELKAAYDRLSKFYKGRLEDADATSISNPAELGTYLTPEHHAACDFFGEDRSWHGKRQRTGFCDICGERMREGAAFHKTEEGVLCVNDWDRAIKAGAKTRAQAYEATEDPKYAPKAPVAAPPTTTI
jgi:hypothetical protein